MNSRICFVGLLMLAGGLSLAYGQEAGKILRITPEQFDFGTVEEGGAATVTAVVHNTGGTRIEITNVRTN
jgi:hypothetical protein